MAKEPTEKERLAILLEDVRSQFRAVAEEVHSLDRKFTTKLEEGIAEIKSDIKDIKKSVTETNQEFPLVKRILTDHEHRIKKLEVIR